MTVSPPLMRSPSLRLVLLTLRPLTRVPFVLPMSTSRQRGGLTSTMKWMREKYLSLRDRRKCAQAARPMMKLSCSRKVKARPRWGPSVTVSITCIGPPAGVMTQEGLRTTTPRTAGPASAPSSKIVRRPEFLPAPSYTNPHHPQDQLKSIFTTSDGLHRLVVFVGGDKAEGCLRAERRGPDPEIGRFPRLHPRHRSARRTNPARKTFRST